VPDENVEIVRRFLRAGVDEALRDVDPDVVWNPIEELPARGHDAVRTSLAHWKAEWHDYELVPEEFLDEGNQVVVTVRVKGRGRGSGVEINARFYDVFTLRGGKITRMDQFTERSEALAHRPNGTDGSGAQPASAPRGSTRIGQAAERTSAEDTEPSSTRRTGP
jgi:ketosteroid isomerase-like protein